MKHIGALVTISLLSPRLLAQNSGEASRPLLLSHVTVIDGSASKPIPDQTVIIAGNRIVRIGRATTIRAPKDTQSVNASGLFLIPGLWDMHVHIWETQRAFPMFIANGVTGVRNMGGYIDALKRWRDEVASGALLGPRMVIGGPVVDGPDPSHPDHSLVVHNATEGRQAVDTLKREGADFVKVYDGVPRDAYFAIAEEAKAQRLPLVGHVPEAIRPSEASRAGQISLEHMGGILEETSTKADEIREIRAAPVKSPAEYPARIAKWLKLAVNNQSPRKLADLATLFVKNGTWQVPTLVTGNVMAYANDQAAFVNDARLSYIPLAQRESWAPTHNMFIRFSPPEYFDARRAAFQKTLDLIGDLHRAGVPFLAGTDSDGAYTYYGFSLHDELAFLVRAGFTPMEALQSATVKPAQFLGLASQLGTIAVGKQANLVLLDANPLDDIHNTRKIRAVVLNGRYFDHAALNLLLAQARAAANH